MAELRSLFSATVAGFGGKVHGKKRQLAIQARLFQGSLGAQGIGCYWVSSVEW